MLGNLYFCGYSFFFIVVVSVVVSVALGEFSQPPIWIIICSY